MRWFFTKVILFSAGLALLMSGVDILVTSVTPWRRYQDPRARILWDGAFDGTRLVLLGDSLFCSFYVDSPEETLWARLEARTGQRVFPGALNGAKPADLLAAAVHVSREWPTGATVFIDVGPTRFVDTRVEDPPMGNYPDVFLTQYGIDVDDDGVLRHLQGQLYRWLLKPFFAARTRSALANMINGNDYQKPFGNFVWSKDREFAMARFAFFERNIVLGASPRPLGWLRDVKKQLEGAGMKPVFVLTPLNEALIRSYASLHTSDTLLSHVREITAAVRAYIETNRAAFIDFDEGFPPECFSDLVHTNACGNDLIAARLAEWLSQDRY